MGFREALREVLPPRRTATQAVNPPQSQLGRSGVAWRRGVAACLHVVIRGPWALGSLGKAFTAETHRAPRTAQAVPRPKEATGRSRVHARARQHDYTEFGMIRFVVAQESLQIILFSNQQVQIEQRAWHKLNAIDLTK